MNQLLAVVAVSAMLLATEWRDHRAFADSNSNPVFDMQDVFQSVRIPNIVVTTDGSVLAFAGS